MMAGGFIVGKRSAPYVRPAFFYTKPFVYKSVANCLIMIKIRTAQQEH